VEAAGPDVCWDRLLFSAKESVFKAWFPLSGSWLGFRDATVTFAPEAGAFAVRLSVVGPEVAGRPLRSLEGRFAVGDGLALTAVVVPR
jgi:4'-phosphopantetheinyl transferase EntD